MATLNVVHVECADESEIGRRLDPLGDNAAVADPSVGRVRVHTTAVNLLEHQIRHGDYADCVPLPAVIGHDISGVVDDHPRFRPMSFETNSS